MSTDGRSADVHEGSIRNPEVARALIRRRFPQFAHVEMTCDWILDTLESGEQYKRARYEPRWPYGPVGNLIRHRREWPLSGASAWSTPGAEWWDWVAPDDPMRDPSLKKVAMYNRASDQAYQIRLMRTPTPTKLREVVGKHVAQIYKQSPRREVEGAGPDGAAQGPTPVGSVAAVRGWWNDVDGKGTSIDEWMRETVAPLLAALGMIDLYCDHAEADDAAEALQLPSPGEEWVAGPFGDVPGMMPVGPPDAPPMAEFVAGPPDAVGAADGAPKVHAQYILPQNVLWFRLDNTGRYYRELLVREYRIEGSAGGQEGYETVYRHWTARGWTLYRGDGEIVAEGSHPFGRVPIVRVFDRQHYRIPHAGEPRFLGIVEKCREFFNEQSELIYAIDLQCFAFLQAPPQLADDDGYGLPMGPGMVVYKVPVAGGGAPSEGYEYVAPDMGPLEYMSQRLRELSDAMDAEAGLSPPATAVGKEGGGPTPASGISKAFDQEDASNILAGLAAAFQAAEYVAAELAATVAIGRPPTPAEMSLVEIAYPRRFNLLRFDQMATMVKAYMEFRDGVGYIPMHETRVLQWMAAEMDQDADPKTRQRVNDEIEAYVVEKKKERDEAREQLLLAGAALAADPATAGGAGPMTPGRRPAPPSP